MIIINITLTLLCPLCAENVRSLVSRVVLFLGELLWSLRFLHSATTMPSVSEIDKYTFIIKRCTYAIYNSMFKYNKANEIRNKTKDKHTV